MTSPISILHDGHVGNTWVALLLFVHVVLNRVPLVCSIGLDTMDNSNHVETFISSHGDMSKDDIGSGGFESSSNNVNASNVTTVASHTRTLYDPGCRLSNEATKVKLMDFFKKVKKEYYESNRYMAATNSEYGGKEIKQVFQPYLPLPKHLKSTADTIADLLKRLDKIESKFDDLNPRELRLIFQFRYFLQNNFDNIYEGYYDGIWMLGPDYFCEQPICLVHKYFLAVLRVISVKTLKDLELIVYWVKQHRTTFEQYLKNVKLGVKSGMVFPAEVCKAAAKTFSLSYSKVHYKGPEGVLKMAFAKLILTKDYYQGVPEAVFKNYKRKHGKPYPSVLRSTLISDFGKPLKSLIKYLVKEHRKYCAPANISGGLGQLPLEYRYKDGVKQKGSKTTKKLPSGEDIDVSKGYSNLLNYYTASNVTAESASNLGYKLVDKFYKQVLEMGHNITKETNRKKMIEKFIKTINAPSQFCNEKAFPTNESDDDAYDRCDSDEGAKIDCPTRWKSKESWFDNIKKVMKKAQMSIEKFFYTEGPKKSTPECDIAIVPEYNPSNGVPSYLESDERCTQPASYFVPFFKAKMGPRYEDFSTNFHEARPGHHLQIQGYLENFEDQCGGISEWITDVNDYYPSFSEGWGVYAENPILLEDLDILKDEEDLATYGVLKWQIWRALRLIVDVGFHQSNMTREEAINLFKKYTWDESDTMEKEVTRYQGAPGQATSYIIGQQTIIKLRKRVKDELGDDFDIKEFHYQVLSQAQSPFDFISIYLDKYVKCKKDKSSSEFCPQILSGKEEKNRRFNVMRTTKEEKIKELFQMFKHRKHA